MKLSTKLYLGFAVVLFFGFVQSMWSYLAIKKNVGKNFSLATDYAPLNVEANGLESAVLNAGYANMRYFYTLTPANFTDVEKFLAEIGTRQQAIAKHIESSEEVNKLTMPDGRPITALNKAIAADAQAYTGISKEIGAFGNKFQLAQTEYRKSIESFAARLKTQFEVVEKYRDAEIAAANELCKELNAAPVNAPAPKAAGEKAKPAAPKDEPAKKAAPATSSPFGKGLFGNGKTGDAPLSLGERVHNVCQALIRRMERYHHFDTMMIRVAEIDAIVNGYRVERRSKDYYSKNNIPTPQNQVAAKVKELESILNSLLESTSKADSQDSLRECIKAAEAIGVHATAMIDNVSNVIEAGTRRVTSYRAILANAAALSSFMNHHIVNDANNMIADLQELEKLSRNMLYMLVLQILIGVGCAYYITNGITSKVTSVCNELDTAASDITDAAGRLTQGALTLAQNVSEQGASVEESSASLEEISSMTAQTSTDAQDTAKNVDGTVNRIMQGTAEMSKMVAAMNEINDSATSIGNIIGTIENIAFQTNLLALNAAVEAARAGEMGKGFAVVAEEVRSLAQRSATAAHETADLITTTIDRIGNGVKISNEVEATFHTIESDTKKINDLVSRISSAMKEESIGISQIKTAVNQLESIAEGNSEISEQTATTSSKMEEQSRALMGIVHKLKAIVSGEDAATFAAAPAAPAAAPATVKPPKALLN